jgi:glucose-1-phosphate adenylyltransferase
VCPLKKKKECIAMLLAGGQGSRLKALTKNVAKPAVSFGGKYRIIDFPLSNCSNSHIDTVGVLTQYKPLILNSYIGTGRAWDLDSSDGGVFILPPYATESGAEWYRGTADAIYQNISFMDMYDSEYVLILSGDQLYRMDYRKMLQNHKAKGAEVSVSVMRVEWEEASRFGIITADDDGRIRKFTEKPKNPDSNLASMGIYIFNKELLKNALIEDSKDPNSEHDFGNNILPKLLGDGNKLYCYEFSGVWKDIGTIDSYYETDMELLEDEPLFDLYSSDFPMMSNTNIHPPQYIGPKGRVERCIAGNGARVFGTAIHSILSVDSYIGEEAYVEDSIILPGAKIMNGARVIRAIVGEGGIVEENVEFGSEDKSVEIAVLGNDHVASKGGAN